MAGRVRRNDFRYSIDYILLDTEAELKTPRLFGRNRAGLTNHFTIEITAVYPRPEAGLTGCVTFYRRTTST